jgi:hypothetical protein
LGHSLTGIAKLPPGSQRDLVDPFAEKASPWPKLIILLILLSIAYSLLDKKGLIYDWTHGWLGNPVAKQVEQGALPAPAGSAQPTVPAK